MEIIVLGGGKIKVIDICCGDALVLLEIKKAIAEIDGYGVDCNIGNYSTHEECRSAGLHLIQGYLQHVMDPEISRLIEHDKFDFVLMLNTYRGWEYANLRDEEKQLPQWADDFFYKYAKYAFITASSRQIVSLMKKGFDVKILGRGEGTAMLIVISSSHKVSFFQWIKNVIYIIFVEPFYVIPKKAKTYTKAAKKKMSETIESVKK